MRQRDNDALREVIGLTKVPAAKTKNDSLLIHHPKAVQKKKKKKRKKKRDNCWQNKNVFLSHDDYDPIRVIVNNINWQSDFIRNKNTPSREKIYANSLRAEAKVRTGC